jgi:hypothetical protein
MRGSTRRALQAFAAVPLAVGLGGVTVALPAAADGPTTFTSSGGLIDLPIESGVLLDNQPASVYPSAIAVSGVTGPIVDVSVTLVGINHFFMRDLDVMLESPSGENLVVLSDAGGGSALDLTLTLTDAATEPVPHLTAPSTTHLPTNVGLAPDDAEDVFTPVRHRRTTPRSRTPSAAPTPTACGTSTSSTTRARSSAPSARGLSPSPRRASTPAVPT